MKIGNTVVLKCKIATQDGTITTYANSLENALKVKFTSTEFTGTAAETGTVELTAGTVYSTALTTAVGTATFTDSGKS